MDKIKTEEAKRLMDGIMWTADPANGRSGMTLDGDEVEVLADLIERLNAPANSQAGVMEALEHALKQFSEPMSVLNGHELGERLAGDVGEIVRHFHARAAIAALRQGNDKLRDAARRYFMGYVQDEADDRDVCIDDEQHEAAKALRGALDQIGGEHG